MGGHVNMMDDVLISNVPQEILRSALRVLVSQGSVNQQPFVRHVRERLLESRPEFLEPSLLFPSPGELSKECIRYLELTRCLFSSMLVQESLPYMVHILDAIVSAKASWSEGSALEEAMAKLGGDMVQAVQALKESSPETTPQLEEQLKALLDALVRCREYCHQACPVLAFPFTRSQRQVKDVMNLLYPACLADHEAQPRTATIEINFPTSSSVETFDLGPQRVPRLFNGLWQLSSPAWGSGTAEKQQAALAHLVEKGLVATDMADHYGDAELIYGDFRNSLPNHIGEKVFAATKWCIFGAIKQAVTTEWVLSAVKERCRRLGGRVELLQLHWYDYNEKEYLDVLAELVGLTKTHPHLVSAIGLCNFDSDATQEACEYLLAKTGTVGIVSNQIQFSLFDSRPLQKMCQVCEKYGVKLLTYGSFCGGFLSDKWLGQLAPEIYSEKSQLTPSQRKYFDMIANWGTWAEFQDLLKVLKSISAKHGVSLTNVATRWLLQQPAVGAVIVGTRLGVSSHGDENLSVFTFELNAAEVEEINLVALGQDRSKALAVYNKLGDCGHEYKGMH